MSREKDSKSRVLVVDDNRLILTMIRDFFEPHGLEVRCASGAREALKTLDAERPDVIVADILMPEMDGWEFFDAVRQRSETAETPFVFLTTETDLPQRLRGLRGGADDYVTKPFAVEELHARVERILGRRERAGWGMPGMLLAGSVEHLSVSDLLQILSLNAKDALVQLQRDGQSGEIAVQRGDLVHAETGSAKGKKALYRMLGWPDARFRVLPLREPPAERTLGIRTSDALMDGLVSLDEWKRLREELPDSRMRLELTEAARERIDRGKVTPAEVDVMAGCKSGLSVDEILEQSKLPDGELARAICALIDKGVLRPVAA